MYCNTRQSCTKQLGTAADIYSFQTSGWTWTANQAYSRRSCRYTATAGAEVQTGFLISLLCRNCLSNLCTCFCRVRNAFKMAQKAIPLVADSDPVEVIYEDDDIIAVNKPAGVISAPKHRFTVSSSQSFMQICKPSCCSFYKHLSTSHGV